MEESPEGSLLSQHQHHTEPGPLVHVVMETRNGHRIGVQTLLSQPTSAHTNKPCRCKGASDNSLVEELQNST